MNKDLIYYKFINCVTGNVIRFLSIPGNEPNRQKLLEEERHNVACENDMLPMDVYYRSYSKKDFDKL